MQNPLNIQIRELCYILNGVGYKNCNNIFKNILLFLCKGCKFNNLIFQHSKVFIFLVDLNVSLVAVVSSLFDISLYTFFCLVQVFAVCKKFGFGPSISSPLKKKKNMKANGVPHENIRSESSITVLDLRFAFQMSFPFAFSLLFMFVLKESCLEIKNFVSLS